MNRMPWLGEKDAAFFARKLLQLACEFALDLDLDHLGLIR